MAEEIKATVGTAFDEGRLVNEVFYFIHFNVWCEVNERGCLMH